MALTESQKIARSGKLTGSRISCLMTGDKEKILELWRDLCGDPLYAEPDLNDIWAVRLGEITEPLNLEFYERVTGRVLTRRGEVIVHPDYQWAAATLDAFDAFIPGPVEAKCVGGFEKFEIVVQRYMPQVHWQMECTQSKRCALSVIEGARKPRIEIIEYDKEYADELMARALRFMEHVWNMTEPVVMEPRALERVSALKDYNMVGNNHWAAWANEWLANRDAATRFDEAEKALRGQIPNDARLCTGYGLVAKRDRANRVSIRAMEDDGGSKKPKR